MCLPHYPKYFVPYRIAKMRSWHIIYFPYPISKMHLWYIIYCNICHKSVGNCSLLTWDIWSYQWSDVIGFSYVSSWLAPNAWQNLIKDAVLVHLKGWFFQLKSLNIIYCFYSAVGNYLALQKQWNIAKAINIEHLIVKICRSQDIWSN